MPFLSVNFGCVGDFDGASITTSQSISSTGQWNAQGRVFTQYRPISYGVRKEMYRKRAKVANCELALDTEGVIMRWRLPAQIIIKQDLERLDTNGAIHGDSIHLYIMVMEKVGAFDL